MAEIEVTAEMVQLVYEQIDFVNHGDDGIAEGLTAVFAIVARDYHLAGYCTEELAPGVRCKFLSGMAHPQEHATTGPDGSWVAWS